MFAGLLGDSTASGVPGQQDWWQDRNLEFDTSKSRLELTRGEQIQHSFENSVDCKGNVGCSGTISITNLRILWVCDKQPSLNLSIGLNIVFTIFFGAQVNTLRKIYLFLWFDWEETPVLISFSKLNNDVAAAADDQYLNITAKTKDSTYQFLFKADDNSRIEQLRATANQFNVLLR